MNATPKLDNAASGGSSPVTCSRSLSAALALVDYGACRDSGKPSEWVKVASPMCEFCIGAESIDLAAARIIALAYRKAVMALEAIEEIYADGCDTYEDWKAMGDTARAAISSENELVLPVSVHSQLSL